MGVLTSLRSYFSFGGPPSPFEPPPLLLTYLRHPLMSLLAYLHTFLLHLRGSPYAPTFHASPIRVVCISDTHTKIPDSPLPEGDLLIHAGDLTNEGTLSEIQMQIDWLKSLLRKDGTASGFQHIVVVCGNHDSYFDVRSRSLHDKRNPQRNLDWGNTSRIHYLEYTSKILTFSAKDLTTSTNPRALKVYGAPQIPKCGGREFAFQYFRGQDAWSGTVPDDIDILVTHAPPKWHLDIPENGGQGCEWLLKECWRVKPTLHVFGHVHAGGGRSESIWWDAGERLWEKLCTRGYGKRRKKGLTLLSELLNARLWLDGLKMLYEDVKGVLWTQLWGGDTQGGILVNAALTYRSTGKLGNAPQVVIL